MANIDDLESALEDARQQVPIFDDSDPEVDMEVLARELKDLHSEGNTVSWEGTCPCHIRDYKDDAMCLRNLFHHLNYDRDFLSPLLFGSYDNAAKSAILPAIASCCDDIKYTMHFYSDHETSDQVVGTKALVFYRRHSFPLRAYLTADEVEFYESMCNLLACILRQAGYTVNGPQ